MKKYTPKQYLLFVAAIFITGIFLFPIYWMIATSVKPSSDIFAIPPVIIPDTLDFSAYINNVIEDQSVLMYLRNSFIVAIGTTTLTLLLALPAAYAMARYRLKGTGAFLLILLVTQMVPGIMMAMPLFIFFSNMNLLNSFPALILGNTTIALPFAVLIMRPFFLSIPKGLEESALIDGCNRFTAFIRVVLPLTGPMLLTVGTFSFLFAWGDLIFALTLTSDESVRPLTVGITQFIGQYGTQYESLMAVATVAALPIIILFIAMQKYIVSGITAGSEK
ncbi:carbohydrate ABC transporter permease [Bacillus sp. FJAT-44742]|uniref:carbohydrate ABC transporter permease n=1 Tax=Bacillus sp. FJAT-44742 TaxID=2014005 RepID=UPI001E56039F|nr:carbohydrate ABC transporter permease [Bacillus sp. FJAT-44742]